MDFNLAAAIALTFVINCIGALAYAARIAGVRTGRIAMSFALFNVLVLISRLSNSFVAPLVAKRVENGLSGNVATNLELDFRLLLGAAPEVLPDFVARNKVGAVVTDFSPLRVPRAWVDGVKRGLEDDVVFHQVAIYLITQCKRYVTIVKDVKDIKAEIQNVRIDIQKVEKSLHEEIQNVRTEMQEMKNE